MPGVWAPGALAQQIDIQGIAKDAGSGRPLSGVIITLQGRGLRDTTDQNGAFRLTNTLAEPTRAGKAALQKLSFSPQGGFSLRMTGTEEVTAEIRNGAGRTVVRGQFTLESGDWVLRPKNLAPGLYTILLRTPSQLRALRLPIPKTEKGRGNPEWVLERMAEGNSAPALARNAESPLDSLRAEKPDYLPAMIPVESWNQSGVSILPKKRDE